MTHLLIKTIILLSFYQIVSSQCTFPSDLRTDWESPTKGNLTFNRTTLIGYEIDTYTDLEFECHNKSGSKYIVRSGDFTVLSNSVNAAMCIKFTKVSSNVYKYFVLTTKLADANDERVKFIQASSTISSMSDICDDSSVANTPQETKLLIKHGKSSSSKIQCPDDILGIYYNHNDSCNETYWDVCANLTTMSLDYSVCSTQQLYSANGTLSCLYTAVSSGEDVLYVYNEDPTVDDSTTYRYTCMVLNATGGNVYMTQHPLECYTNQTSTYVPATGTSLVLTANTTCVPEDTTPSSKSPEESVSNAGLVAGMVVLAILVVAAAGAVVGYCIYTKKFKKVDPNHKRVIDRENTTTTQDHRLTDTVTPSVVQADVKSPKTGGSHGTRRHKRIGIKKVTGPRVALPPVDTHMTPQTRRRKLEKLSLITPRTISRPSSRQPQSYNHNGTQKRTNKDDTEAPKVDTAPPILQLPLAREETFTSISRCSTIVEDKIGIEIVSERKINTAPKTPKTPKTPNKRARTRPSITRQSNRSRRSVKTRSGTNDRNKLTLTVKPLDKSKNKYVKYAKAVFKDGGTVYRKSIKLVGKVQKRRASASNKTVKIKGVTKGKIENSDTKAIKNNQIKSPPQRMLSTFDLVKELERPREKIEIPKTNEVKPEIPVMSEEDKREEIEEVKIPVIETKPESKFIYDNSDNNFFMCSNDEDDSYKAFMEKRKQEYETEEKLNKMFRSKSKLSTTVPVVKKRTKPENPKANNNKTKQSTLETLFKNVESMARFSALRKKFSKMNKESKSQKEAIERNVLSNVHYNNNSKTPSKLQHRSKRFKQAVNLTRTFERIPTLMNWVECSDVLSTPAMKMQHRINSKDFKYDAVPNDRFVRFK